MTVVAEQQVFKTAQVAAILQCSDKTVRNEITRGRLQSCRVGRNIRVTRRQLDAYLESGAQ